MPTFLYSELEACLGLGFCTSGYSYEHVPSKLGCRDVSQVMLGLQSDEAAFARSLRALTSERRFSNALLSGICFLSCQASRPHPPAIDTSLSKCARQCRALLEFKGS